MASPANDNIFAMVNLANLPPPDIVETPAFADLKSQMIAQFVELEPGYRLILESDPVAKLIEAWAYRELILRQRINLAARANLLATATGADLDQLGAFYNVERMLVTPANTAVIPNIPATYEDDASFRYRIQTRIMAWANAGGMDHYKYWALSASPDVLDVAVYSPDYPNGFNMGGHVALSVLSRVGNLVPTDDLVNLVRTTVLGPSVKVVSDIVEVEPAVLQTVNLTCTVKLLPRTPIDVFNGLEVAFRTAFSNSQRLGWDVTLSWIMAQLQIAGVHSVNITTPTADVIVPPNQFPSLGTVTITFAGYSDEEADNIDAMEQARLVRLQYDTYIQYAISVRRTPGQIANDLAYGPVTGVIQPTTVGLAQYLGIQNLYQSDRVTLLTEVQIATLIWNVISPRYAPTGT